MKVYFACSPAQKHISLLQSENVQNFLISYHFIKSPTRLASYFKGDFPSSFILDSGAFSVWANGGTVNIDDYIQFVKEFKKLVPESTRLSVVNLDVLPGKFGERPDQAEVERSAAAGWANMEILRSHGLEVIHVFHQHEDFKWLTKMAGELDYIGISPANDVSMKEKVNWLKDVFKEIKATKKTHGFAVTSHKQLYQFPFYSADSSSWVTPARFARIPIFKDDYSVSSCNIKDEYDVHRHWNYLQGIGITDLVADDWTSRTRLGVKTFQQLEKVATKLWESRGITWYDKETESTKEALVGTEDRQVPEMQIATN